MHVLLLILHHDMTYHTGLTPGVKKKEENFAIHVRS